MPTASVVVCVCTVIQDSVWFSWVFPPQNFIVFFLNKNRNIFGECLITPECAGIVVSNIIINTHKSLAKSNKRREKSKFLFCKEDF